MSIFILSMFIMINQIGTTVVSVLVLLERIKLSLFFYGRNEIEKSLNDNLLMSLTIICKTTE